MNKQWAGPTFFQNEQSPRHNITLQEESEVIVYSILDLLFHHENKAEYKVEECDQQIG